MHIKQNDFNYGILNEAAHRPWPMPSSPWIMTQTWHNLLFAHWPVQVESVRPLVPRSLEIDTFGGQAWIGVVPFFMTNVAPRSVPALPWLSAFAELNVRTYVRHRERGGVFFFSLDAANPLAVRVARRFFHLPYFRAAMDVHELDGLTVAYKSRRTDGGGRDASFEARYSPIAPAQPPAPESLDAFLTERYCLFTTHRSGAVKSVDIHHPRWLLQAAEATISHNTMAAAAGIRLPDTSPLLHFARRQDMVAWALRSE